MTLQELGNYLAAQGEGTVGTTIRFHEMPDETNDLIALYATGSHTRDDYTFGSVAFEHPSIQIVVRNESRQDAYDQAESIRQTLNRLGRTTMTDGAVNTVWHWIECSSPAWVGPDARNRARYSINLRVKKAVSAA